MRLIICVAVEILLFYFLVGHVLIRKLLPRRRKMLLAARESEQHLRKLIRHDRDLMSPAAFEKLTATWQGIRDMRKERPVDPDRLDEALREADTAFAETAPQRVRQKHTATEYLEVLVVALAVAFSVRGLALQPFKIPTGSMQPTLYGFDFVAKPEMDMPNPAIQTLGYLHYSRRYVDETVKEAGYLEGVREVKKFFFLRSVEVVIGGIKYTLPGSLDTLRGEEGSINSKLARAFQIIAETGSMPSTDKFFETGEVLARGYLEAGDHVFVDRVSWNFAEPKRGDITVFITDGLFRLQRNDVDRPWRKVPLNGRYYIKRLVGMPGDELRIGQNGKLYVRQPGSEEFDVVDAEYDAGFARIYSNERGYHGYVYPRIPHTGSKPQYLIGPEATYTVPPGHYFMLGDNSQSSLDSRFWGAVPRENLVGNAAVVWWPYSSRWGVIGW